MVLMASVSHAQQPPGASLSMANPVLQEVPFSISGDGFAPADTLALSVLVGDITLRRSVITDAQGAFTADDVSVSASGSVVLTIVGADGEEQASFASRAIPGWLSIVPSLFVILFALFTRRVVPSLFLGLWLGAWFAQDLGWGGLGYGLFASFSVYTLSALADPDHGSIILFSLMIGGMVGVVTKNAGMRGVVQRISGWANSARRGMMATGSLGIAVFFDDYANTLVVGNAMRGVTDTLRISREKLAYLVDSTAAPVATLALVTTWIGFQVGLISESISQIEGLDIGSYELYLMSIPYGFYPIFAIFFVFLVSWTQRDFGPMYDAEVRARTTGYISSPGSGTTEGVDEGKEMLPEESTPSRAINAVLPILVLVAGVVVGLYVTGEGNTIREIVGSANSYVALMWASLAGVLTAVGLSLVQRILTLAQSMEAWFAGVRSMLYAMIILVLAWSLSEITDVLHTADYLVTMLGSWLNPAWTPAVVFLLAAATAFSTGSSWGTMGILMPIVLPLAWAVIETNDLHGLDNIHIIAATVSCVLSGAVWGDHCSPISDTTVLSSMASGCDHIEHVRTQLPYALTVGLVSIGIGTLPAGYGVPVYVLYPIGIMILVAVHRYFGKPLPQVVPISTHDK